jgi:hypothetical protein
MIEGRIVIIPFLKGKLNFDGTVTKPDIEAILAKWLARHPEFQGPERDYQIIRALSYFEDDIDVGLMRVTAAVSADLANYDPAQEAISGKSSCSKPLRRLASAISVAARSCLVRAGVAAWPTTAMVASPVQELHENSESVQFSQERLGRDGQPIDGVEERGGPSLTAD